MLNVWFCYNEKDNAQEMSRTALDSVVWFFKLKPTLKNMCGKLEGNIQYDNRAIAKTVESYFVKSLT